MILALKNARIQQTADKIIGFENLPVGWHYGSGLAPSSETIQNALKLNTELETIGFSKTNAFPGIEGEIQTTAYCGSLYLEFTIEPDGKITYLCECNNQEMDYQSELGLDKAIEIIRSFRGNKLWALSVSFINSTMTPIKETSKASPLSPPVMEAGSQLSTRVVSPKVGSAFATTSTDIIGTLQGSHLSSGISQPISFQRITGSYSAQALPAIPATTT